MKKNNFKNFVDWWKWYREKQIRFAHTPMDIVDDVDSKLDELLEEKK